MIERVVCEDTEKEGCLKEPKIYTMKQCLLFLV